jgi:hypothetical protein
MAEHDHAEMLRHYICSAKLYDAGEVSHGNVASAVESDPLLLIRYAKIQLDLVKTTEGITSDPVRAAFLAHLNDLFNRIKDLHNELEARDAFIRAYIEDFKPSDGDVIRGKVLYDEREWRSIKIIEARHDGLHATPYAEAVKNKFLPLSYNLRFTADDLQFVVVEHESDKETIRDFLSANACLVTSDEVTGKLVTFAELSRRPGG